MLINKEVFEIVGGILVRWKFDFWVVKWLKVLILFGFSDMGYDNWFEIENLRFCLIFVGFLKIGERLDFLVGVEMKLLYPK